MTLLPSSPNARSLRWLRHIALLPSVSLVGCLVTVAPTESPEPTDAASADAINHALECPGLGQAPYIPTSPSTSQMTADCYIELSRHLGERCVQPDYQCGPVNGPGTTNIRCVPGDCVLRWQQSGSGGPLAPPELA